MLTRRAKAYSSSCSQTVNLQPFRRSSFLESALQPKIAKINKTLYFGSLGSFKVIDVIRLKSSSPVLVTGSMPVVICNRFHEKDWPTTMAK